MKFKSIDIKTGDIGKVLEIYLNTEVCKCRFTISDELYKTYTRRRHYSGEHKNCDLYQFINNKWKLVE